MAGPTVQKVSYTGAGADGYDPDSDSDAEADQSSEGVLLAFVDGELRDQDVSDWQVSRLGGLAVSLPFVEAGPSASDLACRGCGEPLRLLVQVYCPLASLDDVFDRLVHVFSCVDRACQKSDQRTARMRVFRSWRLNRTYAEERRLERERLALEAERKRKADEEARAQSAVNPFASTSPFGETGGLGSMLFGSDSSFASAFQNDEAPVTAAPAESGRPVATESPARPDPLRSLPYLTGFYLDTAPEPRLAPSTSRHPTTTPSQDDGPSSSRKAELRHEGNKKGKSEGEGGGAWSGEKWERQKLSGVDETFLAFQRRLERGGSSQVIRYELGGRPLLFASPAPTASPPCPRCSSPRRFELQLMPASVTLLESVIPEADRQRKGWEWATAWIETCSASCRRGRGGEEEQEEGWTEESVVVQWEA